MNGESPAHREHRTLVWDLPLRLFHWALVLLVISQVVTAWIGGNALEYHALGGYAILSLLLFRIAWGFLGGTHARFGDFVRGPAAVLSYAKSLVSGAAADHRGHNPLGGWSVLAMLASLLAQASTGLFANDDVMMEGPLAKHVSGRFSEIATAVHDVNAVILLSLVALHVLAVVFYLFGKKRNLVAPMITGRKGPAGPPGAGGGGIGLAILLLAGAATAVY
ncbi:MAG TPA: cytochrome b/b6 domain-containing protein, partial [Burkholderiales bacterium]